MPSAMPRLVSSPEQVRASLLTFHDVMNSPDSTLKAGLTKIIPFVHSWICAFDGPTGRPLFAPSKFVGYRNMTIDSYREHFAQLDGRDTERVMKPWLRLVDGDDDLYNRLHDFCMGLGVKPRSSCRISMLRETDDENAGKDQSALTDLLVRVICSLPPDRRQEIVRRIGSA